MCILYLLVNIAYVCGILQIHFGYEISANVAQFIVIPADVREILLIHFSC